MIHKIVSRTPNCSITLEGDDVARNIKRTKAVVIDFYDNDMSVCAQKVRVVLSEKGLEHRRHVLNLRAGDQFKPEYRKLNPNAVVPTIVDGNDVIVESTVICLYLEDAYPEPPLSPSTAVERATMHYWVIKPDAGLHDACGATSFSLAFRKQLANLGDEGLAAFLAKVPNEKRREHIANMVRHGLDAPGLGQSFRLYKKTIDEMEARLANSDWLAGDNCSLADITLLPYVLRLEHLGLAFFWSENGPVANWLDRCKARPAFSAIHDYLDANYLALMADLSENDKSRVRALLDA